jgi:catecholate siderophore receptor
VTSALSKCSPMNLNRFTLASLLIGCSLSLFAADGPSSQASEVIYVYGTRASYAADESSSATRTPTAIEDIAQSVFIITRDVINDQAMTGMGELVRYVPGVTMGQGEGHRDAPSFRGNMTTSDFFIDGVRDDLQYLRDLYNVQRVDILKGSSALVFGRGTGGGALNRVMKVANGESERTFELGASMYGQRRVTADINGSLSASVNGRLNAVHEKSDSFRDELIVKRKGIAPSVRIQTDRDTTIDLNGEYFTDERIVDRGVSSENGRPWSGDIKTFFGNPDLSDSEISVNMLSAVLNHSINNELSFRGVLSYGDYWKFYENVYAGAPVDVLAQNIKISSYNSGTQRTNLLAQADLVWTPEYAGMQHTVLLGLESGRQESKNTRVNGNSAIFDLLDRGRNFQADLSAHPSRDNNNDLNLFAVLFQDQIELTDQLQGIIGVRYDNFDLIHTDNTQGNKRLERSDSFVSPRAGLLWQPLDSVSFYASWSKAFLPQSGEQFSSLDASKAALAPEEFNNTEIGLRWQPTDELLISAALYQLDRNNTRAPGAEPGTIELTGSQRSEGLEIAIQGKVHQGWNIIAAMAYQDAEITSTTSAALAGTKVSLVPQWSASLWNRVQLTNKFDIALGVIYQDEQYTSMSNAVVLPAFTRIDAAIFMNLDDNYELQLNLENLSDEKYWFSAHNDYNISPGAPVMARLRLTARF